MAHYAVINSDNIVTQVFVGKDEGEGGMNWETYYSQGIDGYVLRTSYNTRGGVHYDPQTNEPSGNQDKAFRKNYAGIGYTYDVSRNAFIPPRPFDSWNLDEDSCLWEPPIPMPNDGNAYAWNEENQAWFVIESS
jgi:hypothetical protein